MIGAGMISVDSGDEVSAPHALEVMMMRMFEMMGGLIDLILARGLVAAGCGGCCTSTAIVATGIVAAGVVAAGVVAAGAATHVSAQCRNRGVDCVRIAA